jgi:hypothetical protein
MLENNIIAATIDAHIRKHTWFDFQVFSYDNTRLIIAGSEDLTYYHKLEVIFENVFFYSGVFFQWHSDTESTVFYMPGNEEANEMNRQFEIESGYQLFVFKTEDYQNDVIIAAEKVMFNTDTVFYYNREDLKENERIAHFVEINS